MKKKTIKAWAAVDHRGNIMGVYLTRTSAHHQVRYWNGGAGPHRYVVRLDGTFVPKDATFTDPATRAGKKGSKR